MFGEFTSSSAIWRQTEHGVVRVNFCQSGYFGARWRRAKSSPSLRIAGKKNHALLEFT